MLRLLATFLVALFLSSTCQQTSHNIASAHSTVISVIAKVLLSQVVTAKLHQSTCRIHVYSHRATRTELNRRTLGTRFPRARGPPTPPAAMTTNKNHYDHFDQPTCSTTLVGSHFVDVFCAVVYWRCCCCSRCLPVIPQSVPTERQPLSFGFALLYWSVALALALTALAVAVAMVAPGGAVQTKQPVARSCR